MKSENSQRRKASEARHQWRSPREGVCAAWAQGRPASLGQEVEIQSKRRLRRRGWWREQRRETLVFGSQIFFKNYLKKLKSGQHIKRSWKVTLGTKDVQDKKGHIWRIQGSPSQCSIHAIPTTSFLLLTRTNTLACFCQGAFTWEQRPVSLGRVFVLP